MKRVGVLLHGYSGGRIPRRAEYSAWARMLARCRRTTDQSYRYYGAIGISVCDRWLKFENFLADMGDKPDGFHLDRIDSAGNYEPSNCRWVSPEVSYRNKKHVAEVLTIHGETRTLYEWAKLAKIRHCTVRARIRYGWPAEEAVSRRPAKHIRQS